MKPKNPPCRSGQMSLVNKSSLTPAGSKPSLHLNLIISSQLYFCQVANTFSPFLQVTCFHQQIYLCSTAPGQPGAVYPLEWKHSWLASLSKTMFPVTGYCFCFSFLCNFFYLLPLSGWKHTFISSFKGCKP